VDVESAASNAEAEQLPAAYGELLQLERLLPSSEPSSRPIHHDELQFIIVHQCCELWFKLMLHELDAVCEHLSSERVLEATRLLRRCSSIIHAIDEGFEVMASMTARDFAAFRWRLRGMSGFQSAQFRELEVVLGRHRPGSTQQRVFTERERLRIARRLEQPGLWSHFVHALQRAGYDMADRTDAHDPERNARVQNALRAMYTGGAHPELREFSEELVSFDGAFKLWRSHHAVIAENAIGAKPGTGGEGVDYLYRQARERCFPELVEMRSSL
jgi:tryptophan 2,3-dioxygenase